MEKVTVIFWDNEIVKYVVGPFCIGYMFGQFIFWPIVKLAIN